MSEQLHKLHNPKHESAPKHESIERAKEKLEELKAKAEAEAEKNASENKLENIQKDVESMAVSGKELLPAESDKDRAPSVGYVNKELKEISYDRSLRNIRRHLRAPERVFSKAIHQPIIEKVSDVAGKTVARPSGILGGGIFAIIGSLLLLWVTKKYGYEYNYLVFIMLFITGFVAGMIAELAIRFYSRRKKA